MGLVKVFAVRNLDNLTVKQNADEKGEKVESEREGEGRGGRQRGKAWCKGCSTFRSLREIMQIYGWQLAGRESQAKPRQ